MKDLNDVVTASQMRCAQQPTYFVRVNLSVKMYISAYSRTIFCNLCAHCRAGRPVDICDLELRQQYGKLIYRERVITGLPSSGSVVRMWEDAEATLVSHDVDISTAGRPTSPANGRPVTPVDTHGRPQQPTVLILRFLRPSDGSDGFTTGFEKGLDEEVGRVEINMCVITVANARYPGQL
eukprot:SAG31_NODE_472_length_15237_cov_3.424891_9_plen_180_part_00